MAAWPGDADRLEGYRMIARYTAAYRAYHLGPKDSYGNRQKLHSDPVEFPVFWVAPGAMDTFTAPGRDASAIVWTLATPSPCPVLEHDLVILDGDEYRLNGRPKDWTKGPWPNPVAAVIIELIRKEG